ncbi:laccase [Phellopilus nigrolimitatus]|nr:laccase [Phellopilus nigrolimitatus]
MQLRISLTIFAFVALRLARRISASVVNVDLNIQNANLAPDGFNRSTVTANGLAQGPLISGNIGDQFLINVEDNLDDSTMRRATSIHWHGILQAHTAEMDGPAFVTQCPIVPGHDFLYNFTVPNQTGTYWYHSHLSTQYCDGLRGPLVIYDPEDPHKDLYDIDDDSTIIQLADWYHTVSSSLFPNPTNTTPTPDSTLINGLGRWSGRPTSELAVVRAQPGKRHRFRIINTSCFPSFTFSIDGHNMTVIEADGVEIEPVIVDSLNIFAAQRYSVIVTMDQAIDNYWLRAIPSWPTGSTTIGGINSAILRYDGAYDNEPITSEKINSTVLNESDLHPLINPGAPGPAVVGGADVTLTMNISHSGGQFSINGAPFNPPSVPVLLQILSGTTNAKELLPSGSVYNLPPNQVIEINIPGGNNHPFHLHGHTFDVIRVAGNSSYNFDNPVRRDTVNIGAFSDNVTFRFVTDNSGPWFLHCHIDWHLEAGLAVVFTEDVEKVSTSNSPSTDWSNLCPLYNKLNPDTGLPRVPMNTSA